jgi:hypothetical protein
MDLCYSRANATGDSSLRDNHSPTPRSSLNATGLDPNDSTVAHEKGNSQVRCCLWHSLSLVTLECIHVLDSISLVNLSRRDSKRASETIRRQAKRSDFGNRVSRSLIELSERAWNSKSTVSESSEYWYISWVGTYSSTSIYENCGCE